MRSRDMKIQISMRFPLEGDVLDHVLRFTGCKDLEIVSSNHAVQYPSSPPFSCGITREIACAVNMPV